MTHSNHSTPYEVESGIPIADLPGRRASYPFGMMEVGDSFALPSDAQAIQRVRSAATDWQVRHPPMKFTVRRADPITKAYRCWRIA